MKLPTHLHQFLPPRQQPLQQQSEPGKEYVTQPKRPDRRKRPPLRPAVLATDIYVSTNSKFHAQLQRAMTLLFPGFQRQAKRKISVKDILIDRKLIPAPPIQETAHVDIHGSGTAVQKAVKLALAVQARSGGEVKMSSVKTSSEQVVDDMLLISTGGDKEDDEETKMRTISTIHIRLQREQK